MSDLSGESPQRVKDLHDLNIPTDSRPIPQSDNSLDTEKISVYFTDIKKRLIENILASDAVFACVAWLTDLEILEALSKKRCSIIIQKEDFLRPDGAASKADVRKAYGSVRGFERMALPGVISEANVCSDPYMAAVRCVGNHNSTKDPAHPRMHNKFAVFCKRTIRPEYGVNDMRHVQYTPLSVWTGSFNFTFTANRSFENAVLIRDERIAQAYTKEWSQIAILAEELDWESEWCDPQYRIGT